MPWGYTLSAPSGLWSMGLVLALAADCVFMTMVNRSTLPPVAMPHCRENILGLPPAPCGTHSSDHQSAPLSSSCSSVFLRSFLGTCRQAQGRRAQETELAAAVQSPKLDWVVKGQGAASAWLTCQSTRCGRLQHCWAAACTSEEINAGRQAGREGGREAGRQAGRQGEVPEDALNTSKPQHGAVWPEFHTHLGAQANETWG